MSSKIVQMMCNNNYKTGFDDTIVDVVERFLVKINIKNDS